MAIPPLNHQSLSLDGVDADADYCLAQFDLLRKRLHKHFEPGAQVRPRFLEIGSGHHLGVPLLVRDMGFDVLIADRFAARWQPYHEVFYRHLQDRLSTPSEAIQACLDAGDHVAIQVIEEPLERLDSIPDGSVDFVFSCAVLEHACQPENIRAVVSELARISNPGTLHYHYVDCRDHRDLQNNPFDNLLMTDREFAELTAARFAEDGTRLRALEFEAHFTRGGFEILELDATQREAVPPGKLRKLRVLPRSSYRNWPARDLEILSFMVKLRLASTPERANYLADHGERLLDLIDTFKTHSVTRGNPATMLWRSLFRPYGPYRRHIRPIIRFLGVHYVRPARQALIRGLGRIRSTDSGPARPDA